MKVSVDISLYPLDQNYEPPIIAFIEKLKSAPFKVMENPLSTQVYGDYDQVMDFLKQAVKETFLTEEMAVFNMKFIKGDRS
ncbi:YkoF family thiamine/hydroxymethylpyrimidine-binding protein [Flavobacterium caeni]|uniref:YKOF-related Family n=1 Tax=Flavobacterium caeni TaxID=490189 RepID=A0A1G5IJG2_9FLAO|nr:YkoF family thiamine/hydroxymethylpyrimidine-binding protein [Flavobacterium caeni]SCY76153.1 YKOF-related Family [Flavobacterium caeni]